jgi:hypothetical protein
VAQLDLAVAACPMVPATKRMQQVAAMAPCIMLSLRRALRRLDADVGMMESVSQSQAAQATVAQESCTILRHVLVESAVAASQMERAFLQQEVP